MDRTRSLPRLCFLLTAILTLAAVILRTVAMLSQFDTEVGYFNPSVAVTLNHALYFVTAALLVGMALFIPKNTLPTELCIPVRPLAAIPVGLALAAFTVAALIICVPTATGRMILAPTLLGLPAAVYFFLSANRSGRYSDPLSLAGFLPLVWSVTAIAELYFDRYITMNSPIKVSLHMGLLGFIFIILFELRFRIGRAAPRAALVAFGLGSFACLNGSIPLLVATGARILQKPLHVLYAVVLLTAGLYGLYLLFGHSCFMGNTDRKPADAPTPTAPNTDNAA